MTNELLLIGSVPLIFGGILLAYRLFGRAGMYGATVICTILANIEVLMIVEGFGLRQTLGNVMFAATYLATDILSENEGKKSATRAVRLGIFTSAAMLILTQYWLLYIPSDADSMREHIAAIFSATPRLLIASFLGYAISQRFDVWLYHRIWALTSKRSGDSGSFLWLRNNGATLVAQMLNTLIFTLTAFLGVYDSTTLISIMLSSYIIYVFTSLLDTPAVYIARKMKASGKLPTD